MRAAAGPPTSAERDKHVVSLRGGLRVRGRVDDEARRTEQRGEEQHADDGAVCAHHEADRLVRHLGERVLDVHVTCSYAYHDAYPDPSRYCIDTAVQYTVAHSFTFA